MTTTLACTLIALLLIARWLIKQSHKRQLQEVAAIEAAAYGRGKSEWDAWFEQLYALNPGLREMVEKDKQ